MARLGVVGAGRMGLLFARLASGKGYNVTVYDPNTYTAREAESKGYRVAGRLEELVSLSDYILIATPPQAVNSVLEALSHTSLKNRIVFDIATFKKSLVEAYKKLPREARVASTHPLFGPGVQKPEAHKVAVIPLPGREDDVVYVEEFMHSLGFNTIRIDAETHDKIMGLVIGGSYTVAVIVTALLKNYGDPVKPLELAGTTFKLLILHLKSILNDKREFIEYILSTRETQDAMRIMHEVLVETMRDPLKGAELLEEARAFWTREEILEAYSKLYRLVEGGI